MSEEENALASDRAGASHTASTAAAADRQLSADRSALILANRADRVAGDRLAGDRSRLRALAIGMYTGAITGPQPATLHSLEAGQQAAIVRAEVGVVATVVVKNLHLDGASLLVADRNYKRMTTAVAGDVVVATTDRDRAVAAASLVPSDLSLLSAAGRELSISQTRLQRARAALDAALSALKGPVQTPGGISLLGPPALDAAQLTAWFNAEGYVDLTSASIAQLAGWYIEEGSATGIRGDVAFAQAVLETGGFASPDAIDLDNFAGIGHCDSCSAGWTFPSPQKGVLGQLQLLRIFAGPDATVAASLPPPVLAALTPSRQGRRACCQTWESLTGVWATDPTYGARILTIYGQMLSLALSPAATSGSSN